MDVCIEVPSGGSASRAEPSALQAEPLPNGSPSLYSSTCMRPLPIKDGAIRTGTFRDHDIMCDGMIDAFSRAIDRLGKEEQAIA